jgi:hypothetical protein
MDYDQANGLPYLGGALANGQWTGLMHFGSTLLVACGSRNSKIYSREP